MSQSNTENSKIIEEKRQLLESLGSHWAAAEMVAELSALRRDNFNFSIIENSVAQRSCLLVLSAYQNGLGSLTLVELIEILRWASSAHPGDTEIGGCLTELLRQQYGKQVEAELESLCFAWKGAAIANKLNALRLAAFDFSLVRGDIAIRSCDLAVDAYENFSSSLSLQELIETMKWASQALPDNEIIRKCFARLEKHRPQSALEIPFDVSADDCLLLYDTLFPSPLSSFRLGELGAYLEQIPRSVALRLNTGNSGDVDRYLQQHPSFRGRVAHIQRPPPLRARVGYCIFLNQANQLFSDLELKAKRKTFSLMPGGGFALNDERSDAVLTRLCADSALEKIIATQRLTYEYLLNFCRPERIEYIFGGTVPTALWPLDDFKVEDLRTSKAHETLNVCLVAAKYTEVGKEKGYDVFVDVMNALAGDNRFHFHVVGGFDRSVLPIKDEAAVTFYGYQPMSFFQNFYASMDVFLSPSMSLALFGEGHKTFDGWPLTTCSEAGLMGVALFMSDFDNMNFNMMGNQIFEPGVDFELISRQAATIVEKLKHYHENPTRLAKMQRSGRAALLRELSFERQMKPRIELMQSLLA